METESPLQGHRVLSVVVQDRTRSRSSLATDDKPAMKENHRAVRSYTVDQRDSEIGSGVSANVRQSEFEVTKLGFPFDVSAPRARHQPFPGFDMQMTMKDR